MFTERLCLGNKRPELCAIEVDTTMTGDDLAERVRKTVRTLGRATARSANMLPIKNTPFG
jgi:hypothetical protein